MIHNRTRGLTVARVTVCAILCCGLVGAARAAEAPTGEVQFSDGRVIRGKIYLSRGSDVRIHDGNRLQVLALENVKEIRCYPVKETMERKWRFVEAGRTEKEFWGEPYPVRQIDAVVYAAGRPAVTGHLYTTVFYVEGKAATEKAVFSAKERGKEGETFDDIVFPVRLVLDRPAGAASEGVHVTVKTGDEVRRVELTGLTHGGLVRLPGQRGTSKGEFQLPTSLGSKVFLAVRLDNRIVVGWPRNKESTNLSARIDRAVVEDAKDFFDTRDLLGVYQPEEDTIYSLLLLSRAGKTTLGAAKSQPWRLEIWRWKKSADDRIMVAGRSYFFRGIIAPGDALPTVRTSAELWGTALKDGAVIEVN